LRRLCLCFFDVDDDTGIDDDADDICIDDCAVTSSLLRSDFGTNRIPASSDIC
jgi:hypothetical protein